MKQLKDYIRKSFIKESFCNDIANFLIKESIEESIDEAFFDDVEDITNSNLDEKVVLDFLKENYTINLKKVSFRTVDSKLIVDVDGDILVKNKDLEYLTNDLFEFGEVTGCFQCRGRKNLISLKGAPEKVGSFFDCSECKNLISLEGASKEVSGWFQCGGCPNLTSLKGAPKKIKRGFDCSYCRRLTSLEGAPIEVNGDFDCHQCKNLTSLKDAPDKIKGHLICSYCPKLIITDDDRKKYKIDDKSTF